METYIGTKIIQAIPHKEPGPIKPTNFDPLAQREPRDGYRIKYPDGYESWSPKDVFEEAYRREGEMNFGHALELLGMGSAVARTNWTNELLYLVPAPAEGYPAQTGVAKKVFGDNALVPYTAYIAHLRGGLISPWTPSQTDMLADNWTIVQFEE